MTALVLRGDARALPLPDASVDLIVTSPPYFALRSYIDGGEHYAGQIGSESTPAEYIAALLDCTREWVRVLKPSGSLFVNLGDKYVNAEGGRQSAIGEKPKRGKWSEPKFRDDRDPSLPRSWSTRDATTRIVLADGPRVKSLMGMPWRYALGCIDDLGLILRAELIWSKPNGLPESVTDRVRRSHEQWFHMTKQPRYFAAVDEIREPHQAQSIARTQRNRFAPDLSQAGVGSPNTLRPADACNPLGKLPGSVWDIPSEPLTVPESLGVDHFAAFPSEWPKRLILGWSPSGVCTVCGEGRRPVVGAERVPSPAHRDGSIMGSRRSTGDIRGWDGLPRFNMAREVTGYVCACAEPTAPTTPAVILDPFGGTGTTALAASALGRIGISIDRSADYNRLAQWRTQDPDQRAKVLGVAKPPTQINGQGDLLAELGAAS